MSGELTLLIHEGDVASLAALAMAMDDDRPGRIMLWHLVRETPSAPRRRASVRGQAEHYHLADVRQVLSARLMDPQEAVSAQAAPEQDERWLTATCLTLAMSHTVTWGATRIVWPVTMAGDFEALLRCTEQALMVRQLAQLESRPVPAIETPLAELSDREVVEIAAHLQAPLGLAWSCEGGGEQPCRGCPGCARRKAAFDAAGLMDPIDEPALR